MRDLTPRFSVLGLNFVNLKPGFVTGMALLAALSASPSASFAGDPNLTVFPARATPADTLHHLQELADRQRVSLSQIAGKAELDMTDLKILSRMLHIVGHDGTVSPTDALAAPARREFVRGAEASPVNFQNFMTSYPERLIHAMVVDLLATGLLGNGTMLRTMNEHGVVFDGAVRSLLKGILTGESDKLKVTLQLFDAGFRMTEIKTFLIACVESETLPASLKIEAAKRLASLDKNSMHIVSAIKVLATTQELKPAFVSPEEARAIKLEVIECLSRHATQDNADALWEISGVATLAHETEIARSAEIARAQIVQSGALANPSLFERLGRKIRSCGLALKRGN